MGFVSRLFFEGKPPPGKVQVLFGIGLMASFKAISQTQFSLALDMIYGGTGNKAAATAPPGYLFGQASASSGNMTSTRLISKFDGRMIFATQTSHLLRACQNARPDFSHDFSHVLPSWFDPGILLRGAVLRGQVRRLIRGHVKPTSAEIHSLPRLLCNSSMISREVL